MNKILEEVFSKEIKENPNKVYYVIAHKETGQVKVAGSTSRATFTKIKVKHKDHEKIEIPPQDRNKLTGENIDWEGKTGIMWGYCKEKKCLDLRPDCEICPETGIPRKKRQGVNGNNKNEL